LYTPVFIIAAGSTVAEDEVKGHWVTVSGLWR